jgi:hypothetical protein
LEDSEDAEQSVPSMLLNGEYKVVLLLANLFSSFKKESSCMAAARVLFMLCALDPETSRILLLRDDFILSIQEKIGCDADSADTPASFETVIYLYTELCAAAESEELHGDGRYVRPIEQLLSTSVRNRFLSNLSIDNDALVHASTYALVHLHTLSTARGASPGIILAALPEQRFEARIPARRCAAAAAGCASDAAGAAGT